MQTDYLNILKAVIWMLDGARYLWEENKNSVKEGDISEE